MNIWRCPHSHNYQAESWFEGGVEENLPNFLFKKTHISPVAGKCSYVWCICTQSNICASYNVQKIYPFCALSQLISFLLLFSLTPHPRHPPASTVRLHLMVAQTHRCMQTTALIWKALCLQILPRLNPFSGPSAKRVLQPNSCTFKLFTKLIFKGSSTFFRFSKQNGLEPVQNIH